MPTVEQVVLAYRKVRDQKTALNDEHKLKVAEINKKLNQMENWFLLQLNAQGVESMRTGQGTVFKSSRVSSKVEDWDAALTFIKDHDLWHLLERRVSKAGIEEYENETDTTFPGVALTREITVNVRK